MSKIRIGFVGVGGMGQAAHLRNYVTDPACEVVAIAELRPKLGQAVASRYGIPAVYTDHQQMLAKEKLDGIVASQQFTLHGQLIPQLLAAGVPVLTEKPIGRSREVAEKLVAASKSSPGKLWIGYHKRSDPASAYAKKAIRDLVASKEIGAIRYVRMTMPPGDWVANGFMYNLGSDEGYPQVEWDARPAGMDEQTAKSHESFVNFYIHQVNYLRFLFGEGYEVKYTDPAGIVMSVTSASGVPGVLEMAPYQTTVDWQEQAVVCFDRGYVRIDLPAPLASNRPGAVTVFKDPDAKSAATTITPTLPFVHAMRAQAQNFVRVCQGEATDLCPAEDALADILVADRYIEMIKAARAAKSAGGEGLIMPQRFRRHHVASQPFESAGVFDVDGDGVLDIVSGCWWYQGPDFRKMHFIGEVSQHGEYFDDFSTIALDIDGDGRPDFVTAGFWGNNLRWRQNPGERGKPWQEHIIATGVGNVETTRAWDVDGDGVIEIVPNTPGHPLVAYRLKRDAQGRGTGSFQGHVIWPHGVGHGLGYGDIDGDGQGEFIVQKGIIKRPKAGAWSGQWEFSQEFDLGHDASVPILVEDINGDGLAEIIVGRAHSYGLDWWQQGRDASGKRTWIRHAIDPGNSQYHDLIWADIDGDGKPELITGKRFRAHCGHDPGEFDDLGIYYFKWTGECFSKQVIAYGPPGQGKGCGIHFALADLRGTGRLDIVAPGKDGLDIFYNEGAA